MIPEALFSGSLRIVAQFNGKRKAPGRKKQKNSNHPDFLLFVVFLCINHILWYNRMLKDFWAEDSARGE